MMGLDIAFQCTKFDECSLSRSRDMAHAYQNSNGSRDLTTPPSATVCRMWASTCYDHLIYQIWSLYLHPLRRYERRYKKSKMGWFRVTQGHWK